MVGELIRQVSSIITTFFQLFWKTLLSTKTLTTDNQNLILAAVYSTYFMAPIITCSRKPAENAWYLAIFNEFAQNGR